MNIPFTKEQFLEVFERYNSAVFPVQILIFVLGLAALFLIILRAGRKSQFIGGYLGLMWIWAGLAYHIALFSQINTAAFFFGAAYILQGLFILYESLLLKRLKFVFENSAINYTGYFFILFGLIIYPLISLIMIDDPLRLISPGLPCPTTIMTFGFFMVAGRTLRRYLLIIPSLWAVTGLFAAVNFSIYQDYAMIVAALLANVFLLRKRKKTH